MAKSRFLGHLPCPHCGSRDNLATYEDGSAWCFGCFYRESPRHTLRTRFILPRAVKESFGSVILPYDCTTNLPAVALEWLYKYEITSQEIEHHGFLWSDCSSGLVMPFTDEFTKRLVGYQIRRFTNDHRRRYESHGDKKEMSRSFHPREGSRLLFVEDLLSAIKVNRHVPCVPLYGSHLPLELIKTYLEAFKSFGVWLDSDKRKESVKTCFNLSQHGIDITSYFSECDPKDLTDGAIRSILML